MNIYRIKDGVFVEYKDRPPHTFSIFKTKNQFYKIGISVGFGDRRKPYKPFLILNLLFWEIQIGWFYD